MSSRWCCLALAVFVCASPTAGATQCSPEQINGRWAAYSSNSDAWTECLITVSRHVGRISGRCRQWTAPWYQVAGYITVSRSCSIDGNLGQFGGSFSRVRGTLQADGQAGAGLFLDLPGQPVSQPGLHFSIVKRP